MELGAFQPLGHVVVGTGWIFARLGQSSVAVAQQKSFSMNLHIILLGNCQ